MKQPAVLRKTYIQFVQFLYNLLYELDYKKRVPKQNKKRGPSPRYKSKQDVLAELGRRAACGYSNKSKKIWVGDHRDRALWSSIQKYGIDITTRSHCRNGHKLTPENLARYPLRKGHRICRLCRNKYNKENYKK